MTSNCEEMNQEDAECTVCRSDTPRLCSPCGDPVCHNCACPNGCDEEIVWADVAA